MMLRIFAWKVQGEDFTKERWQPYLSRERLNKASGMREGKAKQLFLAAEVLLNQSLERIGAKTALPAAYTRNVHGKPYLCDAENLYVNWSHSGDCVLCGLSDREIGVDLQYMEKEPGLSLIRKVPQPEETLFYGQTKQVQRKQLFYEYWAVKESYLKARGTGFSIPLDTFYVDLQGAYPQIMQRTEAKPYTCRLLKGMEGYAAAVCVKGAKAGLEAVPVTEWMDWNQEE